ncbi:MAG: hypothetical protein ACRD2C_04395 [Acidimicrobiales bacterium]
MSEGQDQSIFDKAKDMAGGLKDKVTDAVRPDEEQDENAQDSEQSDGDEMRSARDEADPTDEGGMPL